MSLGPELRDVSSLGGGLAAWLRLRWPDAAAVELGEITRAAGGRSGDTLFVDATLRVGDKARAEPLAVRLPPATPGTFPAYDLPQLALVQDRLRRLGLPVAAIVGVESETSWLGAPFLVMKRVPGRVLLEDPPYFQQGWLHDAGPDGQAELFDSFLAVLARIHRVDRATAGLQDVIRPGGPGLAAELDWWDDYLGWATGGSPPPALATAMEWCRRSRPDPEPPPSLLWGDVRLGNVIWDERMSPAAILDWEMVTAAPAELDLAWLLALRPSRPELPGFPSRETILTRYAALLGRELDDLAWYEVFSLVRSAAVVARIRAVLQQQGRSDDWMVHADPVPPRLRRLLAAAGVDLPQ